MKRWVWALPVSALALTAGCRQGPPQPSQAGSAHGRWQVIAFEPSDDTNADGAILLDTQTGQSYVLCDYATAWCKLERSE